MRPIRQMTPAEISDDRVSRWNAYRETLSDEERADLDAYPQYLRDLIHARGSNGFGLRSAKELLVALLDYQSKHQIR